MLDLWIKDADGIILMYSITSQESFEVLINWYKKCYENKKVSIMVVGNKIDLEQ